MNKKALLRICVLILLFTAIAIAISYRDQVNVEVLEDWVRNAGPAAPILFMAFYAIAALLFLPGSIITLAGGVIFGPLWGTLYNLTGATIGATLSFLAARYLASDWVEKKTGGRVKQLISGVEEEGWRFVAFVRLVPLFPFNLLNYALGLTRIRLSHYIITSYICMLPGGFAYTYLGYAGREAVAGEEGVIQKGLLALALLAVVVFIPGLVKRLRKRPGLTAAALKERIDDRDNIIILDVRDAKAFSGQESSGHIYGSLNIPLNELKNRLNELEAYRDQPLAVICRINKMSAKAVSMLNSEGFGKVMLVEDGILQWANNGSPLEK